MGIRLTRNAGKRSEMSSSRRAAWAREFDKRLAAKTVINGHGPRKMRGEWQVPDDRGNCYWRNGNACCGCGKHDAAGDHGLLKWNAGPEF